MYPPSVYALTKPSAQRTSNMTAGGAGGFGSIHQVVPVAFQRFPNRKNQFVASTFLTPYTIGQTRVRESDKDRLAVRTEADTHGRWTDLLSQGARGSQRREVS